jgi:chlorophyll synthase
VVVIGLLLFWGKPYHAIAIATLTVLQAAMMSRFLKAPVEKALWLSAAGVPFYVWGMMVAAFAVRATPAIEALK